MITTAIRLRYDYDVPSGGSTLGPGGHRPPKSCPGSPKFLDTVVLLLVELTGSIVISLSLPNDEGPGPQIFFPRTATGRTGIVRDSMRAKDKGKVDNFIFQNSNI